MGELKSHHKAYRAYWESLAATLQFESGIAAIIRDRVWDSTADYGATILYDDGSVAYIFGDAHRLAGEVIDVYP